jgi:phospholipase/carboxylesterase
MLPGNFDRGMSRREFLLAATAGPLALAAACGLPTEPEVVGRARLRLHARAPSRGTLTGTDVLYGEAMRRAYLRVPPSYDPSIPTPLIIALHGAGGRGDQFGAAFSSRTDALGAIVLAPDSLSQTWDVIQGEFGGDVTFINDVLDQAFDRCNIDASRIALLGFSDGATYALSLGIANGDQSTSIVAFSPGFYVVEYPMGAPAYFISHGTTDTVLPIEVTSRRIVADLRAQGSPVTYTEFEGGHTVPIAIADEAMLWLGERF